MEDPKNISRAERYPTVRNPPPLVLEAVEYFMGARLLKQKRSVPVIVVDHVDEKPLEQARPCC